LASGLAALAQAERLGDRVPLVEVESQLSSSTYVRAEYERSIAYGRRALEHCDGAAKMAPAVTMATCYILTGRFQAAVDLGAPIATMVEQAGAEEQNHGHPYPPYVGLCGTIGAALATLGHDKTSAAWLARAHETAERVGHKYALAVAHIFSAWSGFPT